jgi:uncharacterized protein YkwD
MKKNKKKNKLWYVIYVLYVTSILLWLSPTPCPAREANDSPLPQPGNGARGLDFLTDLEKEVITELNMARTDPTAYAGYIEEFKRHYAGFYIYIAGRTQIKTQEGVAAVNEAIEYLKSQSPLPPLKVSRGLSLSAHDHVKTQGPTGLKGHTGPDNSSPQQRMNRFGSWGGSYGENIEYGNFEARQIIMQLIIDDGVPDRSHRKNIFNPTFRVVGVNFGPHHSHTYMCVLNFAGTYVENN